jgi:hypothetical protein
VEATEVNRVRSAPPQDGPEDRAGIEYRLRLGPSRLAASAVGALVVAAAVIIGAGITGPRDVPQPNARPEATSESEALERRLIEEERLLRAIRPAAMSESEALERRLIEEERLLRAIPRLSQESAADDWSWREDCGPGPVCERRVRELPLRRSVPARDTRDD